MGSNHQAPAQDLGGNINFIPSSSNNTDKSLISIYWNDIINKPNFTDISITDNYSDLVFNKPWIATNNNYYTSSFLGIGKSNPNYNIDINGDINLNGSLFKNRSLYQNSQWITHIENSTSNIYFNDGSISIGSSYIDTNFKLNVNGNIKVQGGINPSSSISYNLGSSEFKWRHLYLSSNSIYLDDVSISKSSDNYIYIPSLSIRDIYINSNATLRFNESSNVMINNNYPVFFDNPYVYSNIVLSNVLLSSSNDIYSKVNSLNTDTIPIPINNSNRFIVNDTYNRNVSFSGIITSSNIITSNINVISDYTTLNTTVYISKKAEIENNTSSTAFIVKQMNITKNLFECYNSSSLSFIINSNGNIGIGGGANNSYKVNVNGSLNITDELLIKDLNVSNIIDLKLSVLSNSLVNYNNHINRPSLSSVGISGSYGDLSGNPFIINGNNSYSSFSGNLGIGIQNPSYKIDINGSLNSSEFLIKGFNLSNIIDLKISVLSNSLISYNNHTNRPSLSSVAVSGNYNDLIGKPVYISDYRQMSNIPFSVNTINNNLIYSSSIGNFGIGSASPKTKVDINNSININGNLRISNVPISFTSYSNTTITSSNGYFSYITNNNSFGYYTYKTSGSITFPSSTNCDILVVAAGGNGGMSSGSGGGGAGEVIYYPNYSFSSGTYLINVGYSDTNTNNRISRISLNGSTLITALGGGNGGMSNASINTTPTSGGSGGGGRISQAGAAVGTKWNQSYSYSTSGATGSATVGGNGGSAINGGYTETITGLNTIVGIGGSGATSTSRPSLKTNFGSGGDGNGGLGTQGIVIIKVPLNTSRMRYDGYINYSNILNRPFLNNVFTNSNLININIYNQVNFPLGDISLANEWFIYMGRSPTNISNSLILWHTSGTTNSKWWFNGTTQKTNNEISDIRVKKQISDIQNPLEKFMLLKPKEYFLCDEKDYLKKYGILAQDVIQTIPEFVVSDTDYIANIYSYCDYSISNSNNIILTINNNYKNNSNFSFYNNDNLQINDEIKILLNNNDTNEIIIEDLPYHNRYKKRYAVIKRIIDEKTIEITKSLELEESEKFDLFIYGKKVNDFLKLDYSSLYTLNIKCNQELYKIYLEQQAKLLNLKQRILSLEGNV